MFERLAGTERTVAGSGEQAAAIANEELFRASTCFKNAVCTVTTNLIFNLRLFTNVFGGQFTGKLPANRLVVKIGGHRYTIITYSSGKIILTNYFFLINNSAVYNLFVNLLELLYALGIAKLQPGTGYCEKCKNDDDEDETGGSCSQCQQRRQIEMLFLIENCIFSFQIAPHFFDRRFANIVHESESTLSMVLRKPRNMRAEGLSAFHDYLKSVLAAEHYQFTSSASCKHDNFPSDLVKFAIQRTDHAKLANYKSPASRKRNNNNFVMQRLAILIFRNGKMIVTGMQTCEDLETTFKILFAIVNFFF
ncbi:MAG: hypothetical protein E6Q06_01995 [Candidatus Moraniibacteriota bacterium]|nr:MAG: hypothetical protein E6Q06_01995 [Candidatus Moranbacteria bacterium]